MCVHIHIKKEKNTNQTCYTPMDLMANLGMSRLPPTTVLEIMACFFKDIVEGTGTTGQL